MTNTEGQVVSRRRLLSFLPQFRLSASISLCSGLFFLALSYFGLFLPIISTLFPNACLRCPSNTSVLAAETTWSIKKLRIMWQVFSHQRDPYIDITDDRQLSELRKRLGSMKPLGHLPNQPSFTGGYMFSVPPDQQNPARRWFILCRSEITLTTDGKAEYFKDLGGAEKYIKSLFDLPSNQKTSNPRSKEYRLGQF